VHKCTIALVPHSNKILLKIIQIKLVSYIGYEMQTEEAGLRKGAGRREQIANVIESRTVQRSTTKMLKCFIGCTTF